MISAAGDGAFLARLSEERGAIGVGVDIDPANLVTAVSRGLDVIQEDINDGLHCFTTNRFDVVILAQCYKNSPIHISRFNVWSISQMKRSCRSPTLALVVQAAFGYQGRMPMSRAMPRHWYDTPNIHFCTVTDFDALCSALHIDIIERATIAGPAQHFWAAGCPIFSPPAPFTVSVALAANRAGADGVGDTAGPRAAIHSF